MAVRPVSEQDFDPLAGTLTRAFDDDPVTRWVYADGPRRLTWSRRFFAWQLRRLAPQDVSWTTDYARGAAALWSLPERVGESGGEPLSLVRQTLPGVLPRLPRVLRGLGQV